MQPIRHCRITRETLLDYIDGNADVSTAGRIRSHLLARCQRCSDDLACLKWLLSTMRKTAQHEAPASVVQRAKGIFRERSRSMARSPVLAQLFSDSRCGIALAGARGAERSGIRTVYATERYDIEAWQEREPGGMWYVIGQVTVRESGDALRPETVELTPTTRSSEAVTPQTAVFEADEFHIPAIGPGSYILRLALSGQELILAALTIGELLT